MAFKLLPYPCNEKEPFARGVKKDRLLLEHPFHKMQIVSIIMDWNEF